MDLKLGPFLIIGFLLFEFAMGKPTGRKKQHTGGKTGDTITRRRSIETTSKAFDEDMTIFINMSQELKEEGNKRFQKRDHEGALLKYEKAIKLLPKNHIDVVYLHTNMASCFMQMGCGEYDKAIIECNLALEVSPKYSKALLKRARCYEALNKLELAFQDVNAVLSLEPNNVMALEITERVKRELEKKGITPEEILSSREYVAPTYNSSMPKAMKSKARKKKSNKSDIKSCSTEDKAVVEETKIVQEEVMRTVKLVFGEDIRCAQVPSNCSVLRLSEIVKSRFPSLKAVLIKYKDNEGDLVTITTTEELRWAEASADPQGSLRLYVTEVTPDQEPSFDEPKNKEEVEKLEIKENGFSENGSMRKREENGSFCIDNWIVQFARIFKNHVGFNSDAYLDLHQIGMKLYSEAIEDIVTSEEAQDLFKVAAEKFQEMTALALFNWGNVHMAQARKKVILTEEASRESLLAQVKTAYEWGQSEYVKAGGKYREALKFKPDFYEALLALGQQQFEQAKVSWYYAVGSKVDLDSCPYQGVIGLFDNAEECITNGSEIWEVVEEQRLNNLSKPDEEKMLLQKLGVDLPFKDISAEEAAEQVASMRSQINILWGTLLYERSIVEFKLGIEFWEDTLETAIERFELAGASQIDTAVMRKNHCSNSAAQEGLGFDIDEIVQAWNEMYDAKRWLGSVPSFRLEPLLRRQIPKLHQILEHI